MSSPIPWTSWRLVNATLYLELHLLSLLLLVSSQARLAADVATFFYFLSKFLKEQVYKWLGVQVGLLPR